VLFNIHFECRRLILLLLTRGIFTVSDYINPIEEQLLKDFLALYTCDLRREHHHPMDEQCLVCSKLEIILAIEKYQALNAPYSPEASSVVTGNRGISTTCPAD
jgi:hypothetical protein